MKRTIALLVTVFLAGNVMSQNLDSVPPKKIPEPSSTMDTTSRWKGDSALGSWKQDSIDRKAQDTAAKRTETTEKKSDRAMMKEGEMVIVKNGVTAKMTEDFTFPSGTVIKPDGTVKKKDGSEIKLKDGQFIELPAADDSKKKKDNQKRED